MAPVWTIDLSTEATSDYENLDHSVATSIDAALEKLTAHPELRGYSLRGNLAGFRALVVGKKKIRIVYKVNRDRIVASVIAIGHRRNDEVYLKAVSRTDDSPEG